MSKALDHIRHIFINCQTAARAIDNDDGNSNKDTIISSLEKARQEIDSALLLAKRGEIHTGAYVGMPKKMAQQNLKFG